MPSIFPRLSALRDMLCIPTSHYLVALTHSHGAHLRFSLQVYDTTWPTRAGLLFVASLASFLGLIGLVIFVCAPHVRASRIVDDSGTNNIVF
jgi:hypothetical protein